jgi:hypothetical protein
MVLPQSERQGNICQKWHSTYMGRGALMLLTNGQGGATLHKFLKKVKFSKEKLCFELEIMGLLLPNELGVMNNCINGFKGWLHLKK